MAENNNSRAGENLSAGEANKKINFEEELEKNIIIRTMPKKFKTSSSPSQKKNNQTVGIIIMAVGILVFIAAIYLAYVFLINPKSQAAKPAPKNTPAAEKKAPETPAAKETPAEKPATSTPLENPANNWIPSISSTTPTSTPEIATSTNPNVISISGKIIDSDSDGLSDDEEKLLGSNPQAADSDGDTYPDKTELEGLYNPAGAGKLIANRNIAEYKNAKYKYSIFYPSAWRVQDMGGGDSIIFSSPANTLLQVIAQPNEGKQGILDWYNSGFSDSPAAAADVISKNGWEGLYHQDKKIFYLTDDAKTNIYIISYVPESDDNWNFYNIFQMMINSFSLK